MRRYALSLVFLALCCFGAALAQQPSPLGPLSVLQPAADFPKPYAYLGGFDADFQYGRYFGVTTADFSITRASTNGTDLLPSDPAFTPYQTFGADTLRIKPLGGLIIENARTQLLASPTAPATQTTGSLTASTTYTLWVNGSGTATLSNGTGTGCVGIAGNTSPATFTMTGTGTCNVTVAGALMAFQLEAGAFASSFITTAAARNADQVALGATPLTPFKASAVAVYFDAILWDAAATYYMLADTTNNRVLYTPSGNTNAAMYNGTNILSSSVALGQTWKTGMRAFMTYDSTGRIINTGNGSVGGSDSNTMPNPTAMGLMSTAGTGNYNYGIVRRLAAGQFRYGAAFAQAETRLR
jgi:hypothetical protein